MKFVRNHYTKLIIIFLLALAALIAYIYRDKLREISVLLSKGSLDELVAMMRKSTVAPLISISLMVLQAFIAPIPSFLIAGANGIVFGVFWGTLISWFGAMLGAAGTFYLARILGEPFVKRFEKSSALMRKVDEISEKHGAKVIFVGRLLPFVSFDFLSYAAGLSTMKAWQFFVATGIGMIPGTILYVAVGNGLGRYQQYFYYAIAIIIIAVIAWTIYKWKKRKQKEKDTLNKY